MSDGLCLMASPMSDGLTWLEKIFLGLKQAFQKLAPGPWWQKYSGLGTRLMSEW